MPSGFDVESGTMLTPRLARISSEFRDTLKNGRLEGRITKDHPITAKDICDRWNAKKPELSLEGSDVRALVGFWRFRGEPIASQSDGYFYALTKGEMEETIQHYSERVSRMSQVLNQLKATYDILPVQFDPNRRSGDDRLRDLTDLFGLEPVSGPTV